MPRRRDLPCSDCGTLLWRGRGSAAVPMCRDCRREAVPHGANRYQLGCRCDECKSGHADKMRAYAAARRERQPEWNTAEGGRDRSGEYAKYGYRDAQRRRDELRRARKRGVDSESFDSAEVYERDSWVCGICSDPVDPELSYPHPLSASLDHIEPLSLGGAHTRANSRCAHLRCNIRRGNRVAQLSS